ncbi:chemotaxis protein CheW [Thermomonas brevis]|uniref:Chemotaxis protein CheW n=1 Tax=Thermomonas brevis TaxID=215691 RepID=A0A7G9QTK2_9GAMM|nr:chemotaxis protein CheW [Thermomonas brevis]QNN46677.1 chemotaxis protein CheW [Thermomonas brevis]
MSPQGTTLAAKPESDVIVDAYVDALLGMPTAASPQADATAAAHAPEPAAGTEPAGAAEPVVLEAVEPEPAPQATDEAAPELDGDRDACEPDNAPEPEPAVAVDPALVLELLAEFERETQPAVAPETAPATLPVSEPAVAQVRPPAAESRDVPAPFRPVEVAAGADAPAAPVGQRWLRVSIGDDRYAVELLRVQEVVRLAPVIAVRGAVPSLLGVMNLRGRVVPVHDLGLWLRRAAVRTDERSRIVVLEYKDELVGLLVTAVTDVVTLDAPQIEPPTPGLRDRIGMGIARTPGAPPTVLLDARVVFD